MDLVFHSYADILKHVAERRSRAHNQREAAFNPPLGSGPKPTKAQRDRLVGECFAWDTIYSDLQNATFDAE